MTWGERVAGKSALLVWLQYVIALVGPIGLLVRHLRQSLAHTPFARSASGYAISTVYFSLDTIPRFFLPLAPLSLAIVNLALWPLSARGSLRSTVGDVAGSQGGGADT